MPFIDLLCVVDMYIYIYDSVPTVCYAIQALFIFETQFHQLYISCKCKFVQKYIMHNAYLNSPRNSRFRNHLCTWR